MPLEIKDKRSGEVKANAVVGNTIRCGHCNQDILDDSTWLALDDPYYCLIHQTCMSQFQFDGMARSANAKGRKKAEQTLDEMQKQLLQMVSRPWWRNNKGARHYHKALMDMLMLHQSLRSSGNIVTVTEPPPPQNTEQSREDGEKTNDE